MGDSKLTCANCGFWQPRDREHDYAAPCELGMYTRPPADFTCDLHSAKDAVPATTEDTIAQQSAVRGPPWSNPGRKFWP